MVWDAAPAHPKTPTALCPQPQGVLDWTKQAMDDMQLQLNCYSGVAECIIHHQHHHHLASETTAGDEEALNAVVLPTVD